MTTVYLYKCSARTRFSSCSNSNGYTAVSVYRWYFPNDAHYKTTAAARVTPERRISTKYRDIYLYLYTRKSLESVVKANLSRARINRLVGSVNMETNKTKSNPTPMYYNNTQLLCGKMSLRERRN